MSRKLFGLSRLIAALLLLSSSAHALQTYTVKDQHHLDVVISSTETNRLSLQGDRICQVFGVNDDYALETDEQGGQIFLKALSSEGARPVTLTLVSEKGFTYDLRLTPRKTEAQSILLKEQKSSQHAFQQGESSQDLFTFVKDFATQTPRDDVFINRRPAQQNRETADILGTLLFTYENDDWQGLSFIVRNKQPYQISLFPQTFARSGDQVVACQDETLAPFASTKIYVIRRKAE